MIVRVWSATLRTPNPTPRASPHPTQVIAGQQKETRATINLVDLAGSERASKSGATGPLLEPLTPDP